MLKYAKKNAEKEKLENFEFFHLDWLKVDLKEMNWENKFDLSFGAMCPGISTKEGLEKFVKSSKKYCMVNQFIENNDNIGSYIREKLDKTKDYDPHNDRDRIKFLFNYLWEKGYSPEISYITECNTELVSIERAYKIYEGRYKLAAENKNIDLKKLIKNKAKDDTIKIVKDTTMAMVLWKVK